MTSIQPSKKAKSLVEQSTGMGSRYKGRPVFSSGNSGHGVPDRDRFQERRSDSWHPKHARYSGYQRSPVDHVRATATTNTRAYELPTWYRAGTAIITAIALIVFLILFP